MSNPKELTNRIVAFFREVYAEGEKVRWPDRDQLTKATIVVVVIVALVASYMGLVDAIFAFLFKTVDHLMGRGV